MREYFMWCIIFDTRSNKYILDPIRLITGIQSVSEPRGELVAPNCEILEDSHGFSKFFTGFPNAWNKTMFPWLYEKSANTTWKNSSKSRTQWHAFSSCRRFSCYVATLNVTLTDPKSRFRTVSRRFCDVWWHDHILCSTSSSSRYMSNLISSGDRRHWSGSRQHISNHYSADFQVRWWHWSWHWVIFIDTCQYSCESHVWRSDELRWQISYYITRRNIHNIKARQPCDDTRRRNITRRAS